MARPQREGIEYFSMDVDFFSDRKIKVLKGRFGSAGITFYLYLLCEIYHGHGYYLKIDEDFEYLTSSDLLLESEKIMEMLSFLLDRGLFDKELFESYHILTSASVQRRYQMAVKTRAAKTNVFVDPRFWILSKEETHSFVRLTGENDAENHSSEKNEDSSMKNEEKKRKNDIKERKEKESKEKESRGKQNTEEKKTDSAAAAADEVISLFCKYIGPATSAVKEEIEALIKQEVSVELICAAIREAALSGAASWKYVQAILARCKREKVETPRQFYAEKQTRASANIRNDSLLQPENSSMDWEMMEGYLHSGRDLQKFSSLTS